MIDVHAHAASEDYLRRWAERGIFELGLDPDGVVTMEGLPGPLDAEVYQHETRFERMERMGNELQLVSPLPNFTSWVDGACDVELARELNASTVECVEGSDGRFAGLAALALAEPERAVDELSRAVEEQGMVGAIVGTYAGDRPLDHPSLDPLLAELSRRELPVLVHPTSAEPTPRWREYSLMIAIEWPNQTTLAVSRLIFSGALERHPGLRLMLSHGGGALPYLHGRLDLAYEAPNYEHNPECQANISKAPSTYLDRLYYDTAVASPESLHFLIDLVGADRVVFGTDDPFEISDTGGRMALPALEQREESERERILGGTARGLLGR